MGASNSLTGQVKSLDVIAGYRRLDRRYGIELQLRWKLIRRRRVLDNGQGRTIDLSSGGLLFDAGRALPVGLNVEMSILWPVLLQDVAPLQLLVFGRIVRSENGRTALRMVQHEFRTTGAPADQRAMKVVPGQPQGPTMRFAPVTIR